MEQLISDKCMAEIDLAKRVCANKILEFEKRAKTATPQEAIDFFREIKNELKNKIELALKTQSDATNIQS